MKKPSNPCLTVRDYRSPFLSLPSWSWAAVSSISSLSSHTCYDRTSLFCAISSLLTTLPCCLYRCTVPAQICMWKGVRVNSACTSVCVEDIRRIATTTAGLEPRVASSLVALTSPFFVCLSFLSVSAQSVVSSLRLLAQATPIARLRRSC